MNLTRSALDSIRAADLSESAALEVVHMLTWKNFRKSMPCNHDYRVWQDVYFIEYRGLTLYVKFQKADVYFVISFKESEGI